MIMEHHLHLIASSPGLKKSLKKFKSFTEQKIVDYVQGRGYDGLLEKLHDAKEEHKTRSM
jgi:hypothetical protein